METKVNHEHHTEWGAAAAGTMCFSQMKIHWL